MLAPFSPYFGLALLNSWLLNWRFKLTSSNNNVNAYEIDALPVPKCDFATHKNDRDAMTTNLIAQYEASDFDRLLAGVEKHLASHTTDVIHDLLAYLAEKVIEMNKDKQAETEGFLDWLAGYTSLPIEDWRLKTVVKAYWENGWDEVRRALRQNRKAIEQASGQNVEGRQALEAVQSEFDQSVARLKPLLERIGSTDRLIDLIVYRLYGLTEEEVAIVEGE